MQGSGGSGKAVVCTIGVIAVFVLLFYFFQKLNEISDKVDDIADNQRTRPNRGSDEPIDVTPEKVAESPSNKPETLSAIVPVGAVKAPDFHHSEDFQTITAGGVTHSLTLYQSRALEKLWNASKNRVPELHQAAILEGIESCSKRLRDVFKSNMAAYRALIARGKRKGTFRLRFS
jgi:hypothetical protein